MQHTKLMLYMYMYMPTVMNPILLIFIIMLVMKAIFPVIPVTRKPAVISTWKMKNCSIDDMKKDTTFTMSPMLNGC